MKFIKNSIIIVLSIMLILLTLLVILHQSISTTIIKPYDTQHYIEDSGIYVVLESEAKEKILNDIEVNSNSTNILFNVVMKKVVDSLVTEEKIAETSDELQTIFWDYITGESDSIENLSLFEDMNNIKNIIENEVNKVSDENIFLSTLKNEILHVLEKTLPVSIELKNYIDDESMYYLDNARYYYQQIQIIKVYVYALILILVLLILFVSRKLKKSTRTVGYTLTISGILAFLPPIFINFVNKDIFYDQFVLINLPDSFYLPILNIFDLMINEFTRSMILLSLIVLALGIILLIIYKLSDKISNRYRNSENVD